jgi:hypothetical protein
LGGPVRVALRGDRIDRASRLRAWSGLSRFSGVLERDVVKGRQSCSKGPPACPHNRLVASSSPPRSPARIGFPDGGGIVFNFPGLWRERGGRGESLPRGIRSCRQKSRPGLCPRQTLSRQELAAPTETGSTLDRDGFESEGLRGAPVRLPLIPPTRHPPTLKCGPSPFISPAFSDFLRYHAPFDQFVQKARS